jgi:hypothetical protein
VFGIRQTSLDTEVVGDLLVLMHWLHHGDSDGLFAAIVNDTGNQNNDNSAMRSSSVVSTRR